MLQKPRHNFPQSPNTLLSRCWQARQRGLLYVFYRTWNACNKGIVNTYMVLYLEHRTHKLNIHISRKRCVKSLARHYWAYIIYSRYMKKHLYYTYIFFSSRNYETMILSSALESKHASASYLGMKHILYEKVCDEYNFEIEKFKSEENIGYLIISSSPWPITWNHPSWGAQWPPREHLDSDTLSILYRLIDPIPRSVSQKADWMQASCVHWYQSNKECFNFD